MLLIVVQTNNQALTLMRDLCVGCGWICKLCWVGQTTRTGRAVVEMHTYSVTHLYLLSVGLRWHQLQNCHR